MYMFYLSSYKPFVTFPVYIGFLQINFGLVSFGLALFNGLSTFVYYLFEEWK